MTVWRIALDGPTQSRGEVWRQTLRWRSGGKPAARAASVSSTQFRWGDGPARGADGRAPGPKAPSQHRPRRRRGTIACTTGTAPVLGGSPDCPAIVPGPRSKGRTWSQPDGLEQSDSNMVVTSLVPGGRVTLGGAGGAKARSGRSERQRSDHARERTPCGTGGRPGTDRRQVPDTAWTSIHDPPSGRPAISASAYTSCQPALADSIPCTASSLSSPKSGSALAFTAALRNSRKRSPTARRI